VFQEVDLAYAVVGNMQTRSKAMNIEPLKQIKKRVSVRKVLRQPTVEPSLDAEQLLFIELADIKLSTSKQHFVHAISTFWLICS
jgi:hypothetical protein